MASQRRTGIDRGAVEQLRQPPITAAAWRSIVRDHDEFVATAKPGIFGKWQVLEVAGLPLAVWGGETSKQGKQLNLNLGNLTGLDLSWAPLPFAALPGVFAEGIVFRGATLSSSLLTDARLDRADFSMTKCERADFSRSSLRGASFKKALLIDTDFEDCDLEGADFRGARVKGARLVGAKIEKAIGLTADE
jgi:uncharacterized protein YjbI with pentapeptide repeats